MAARRNSGKAKAGGKASKPGKASSNKKDKAKQRTLAELFANVTGRATGLPPDASVNHALYLYGAPKQQ